MTEPQRTPTGERQSKPNDQIDGEMCKFIQVAAGSFERGMTVEQLHEALSDRNTALLKAFDDFIKAAREGGCASPDRGDNWKQQGNAAFKKKSYDQAIICYTRALHDMDDHAKIAATLNNRATCLFHMELYEQSLADATEAITLAPDYLKAFYRRGHALLKLGHAAEGQAEIRYSEGTDEAPAPIPEELQAGITAAVDAVLRRLFTDARKAAPVHLESSKVELQECFDKGRKLFAKKAIQPGDAVLSEDCYAAALRGEHLLTHCDWCLQHTPNLYSHRHLLGGSPSPQRARGLYCSRLCAEQAMETYLDLEVRHPFFLVCPLDCLVAVRRMLRWRRQRHAAGGPSPNEFAATGAIGVEALKANPALEKPLLDILEGHTHESEATLSIGGNESAVAVLAYHSGALAAVALHAQGKAEGVEAIATSMATDGAIGSTEEVETQRPVTISVPELWEAADELKLAMRQLITNGVGVSKLLKLPSTKGVEAKTPVSAVMHSVEQRKVATALYPHVSMVNHSCKPNAFLNFSGGPHTAYRRVHLRATQVISAGEEICISYGPHKNKIHSSKNRREALQSQYNFLCFCEACTTEVDEPLTEEKQELMVTASTYYQKGRTMMRHKRYADAIPAFEASLDLLLNQIFIGKHRSSFVIGKTHDAAAECYAIIGEYEKSMRHCKQSVESTAYVNGETQIETAHEYLKLSGLAAQCGSAEQASEALRKAEGIFRVFYGDVVMPEVEECREAIQHLLKSKSG